MLKLITAIDCKGCWPHQSRIGIKIIIIIFNSLILTPMPIFALPKMLNAMFMLVSEVHVLLTFSVSLRTLFIHEFIFRNTISYSQLQVYFQKANVNYLQQII
jgi:hypothetical protein